MADGFHSLQVEHTGGPTIPIAYTQRALEDLSMRWISKEMHIWRGICLIAMITAEAQTYCSCPPCEWPIALQDYYSK
ncbi:hypothetical protein WJX84_007631 [Apatococcus fuscideae]|uniref:Uncharacterized protein n=1 Tax=Apatococcus fuscideae TaxID=2026836 RepID=A0AAW1TGX2_9CHLO